MVVWDMLEMHEGLSTKTIITNQDRVMKSAINKVFPNAYILFMTHTEKTS